MLKKFMVVLLSTLFVFFSTSCKGIEEKKEEKKSRSGIYNEGTINVSGGGSGNIQLTDDPNRGSSSSGSSSDSSSSSSGTSSGDGNDKGNEDSSLAEEVDDDYELKPEDDPNNPDTFDFKSIEVYYIDESEEYLEDGKITNFFKIDKNGKEKDKEVFNIVTNMPPNSVLVDNLESPTTYNRVTNIVPYRVGYKGTWTDKDGIVYKPGSVFKFPIEDGGQYKFYVNWKADTNSFFGKYVEKIIPNSFSLEMSKVPKGARAVKTIDSNLPQPPYSTRFSNDSDFLVSTTDITGQQIVSLIGYAKQRKNSWGFTELIPYQVIYNDDYINSYYEDKFETWGTDCKIMVNGVKILNGSDGQIIFKNIGTSNSGSNTYPACSINFPQAVILCNMMTAAYNANNTNKLTYAYAYGLTTEVNDSRVMHHLSEVTDLIKNHRELSSLALEGATGFRLPTSVEYQLLSSIIPTVEKDYVGKIINNDNPGIMKQEYLSSGQYNSNVAETNFAVFAPELNNSGTNTLVGQQTMGVTDKNVNALGLYNCIGNIRKWLDTRIDGTDCFMVRSGSYIHGMSDCKIGKFYDDASSSKPTSYLMFDNSNIDIGMRVVRSL